MTQKRGRNLELGEVPCREGAGQLLASSHTTNSTANPVTVVTCLPPPLAMMMMMKMMKKTELFWLFLIPEGCAGYPWCGSWS